MKALVAFLLLVCAGAAQAWCSLPPPAVVSTDPPVQLPFTAPKCMPAVAGIAGTGKGFLQSDFPAVAGATAEGGSCWGWWCQEADLTWTPYKFCSLDKYKVGKASLAVATALAASSPFAALQETLTAYSVKTDAWSEKHDYNCLHNDMLAALQATKPPSGPTPVVYRTPPGGSAIYPAANGKLGVPTSRRAPGSALCDCVRLKITSGAYTYCALDGGPVTEAVLAVKVGS